MCVGQEHNPSPDELASEVSGFHLSRYMFLAFPLVCVPNVEKLCATSLKR